jgi:hypothetical protein
VGIFSKILSLSTPGILINSAKAALKGEVPPIVAITKPARDSFLQQYGAKGLATAATGGFDDKSVNQVVGMAGGVNALVGGTQPKSTNPTTNPNTGQQNPAFKTPGINGSPVLYDDVTNNGLNPLWLLATVLLLLLAKRYKIL